MTIKELLDATVAETGVQLSESTDALSAYVAARAVHLSSLVGQPGFEFAVQAERDSVALRSGLAVHDQARGADQRILGIIQAALSIGARAAVAAA